jgi:hypothetical protein
MNIKISSGLSRKFCQLGRQLTNCYIVLLDPKPCNIVLLDPKPCNIVLLDPKPCNIVLLDPTPFNIVLLHPTPFNSVLLDPKPFNNVLLDPKPCNNVLLDPKPCNNVLLVLQMYSSNANPDLVSKLCNSSVQMLLRLNFRKEWPKDQVRPSKHVNPYPPSYPLIRFGCVSVFS